uniref:Bcl-2-like protein 10 n=1 Tax=Equus caballus TaxID=9796 RepID=F6ZPD4_HORSE
AVAEALRERTALLLIDYLQRRAREPATPEVAVLRCVAAQIQPRNQRVLSRYRGFRGDHVGLAARMAQAIFGDRHVPSWGRVAALVTLAGTLLERAPRGTYRKPKRGYKLELREWKAGVDRDWPRLVDFLCAWLKGRHRAWLEAHYGWDGFCDFSLTLPASQRILLVRFLLSCFSASVLIYLWTKLS